MVITVANDSVARSSVLPGNSIGMVITEGKWIQLTNPSSARLGNSTSGDSEMKLPNTATGMTTPAAMISGRRNPIPTGTADPASDPTMPKNDGIATTCPARSSDHPHSCW